MTEEEQLESIKKWWKLHGNTITTIIAIVLLTVAGYRYYTWHENKLSQQASIAYEQMMLAMSHNNSKEVKAFASDLTNNYQNLVYSDIAHLTLAKEYVSSNNLKKAQFELNIVANRSKVLPLKQIAKIRLARLLAAQKLYSKALEALNNIDDKTYLPIVNELKGDMFTAEGKYAQAFDSYHQALGEIKKNGMTNSFLEMKTNALAVKNQNSKLSEKKIQTI